MSDILETPSIIYVVSYPPPNPIHLEYYQKQIKGKDIDIIVVQTLMSGNISTMGEYPMSRFVRQTSENVPTFLIPDDTKAHERRGLFYNMEISNLGVIPLDGAFSKIADEVCGKMVEIWKQDQDPLNLVKQIKEKYQL